MANIGLVLGGGGVVGIAWEIGVLSGLEAAGFRAAGALVIVGTSAGSVVGTRLRLGHTLAQMESEQARSGGVGTGGPPPDVAKLMEIFELWGSEAQMSPELARKVGALALEATTQTEENWVASFETILSSDAWPRGDLRITAVSCETGDRVVWTKESGVPLARAVATSCTVPGLFPPVGIDGVNYIDGGVWSGSNADLLPDVDTAVFIGPMSGGETMLGRLSAGNLQREEGALAERGIPLHVITPGREFRDLAANLMDPTMREPALAVGRADGTRAAETLGSVLF